MTLIVALISVVFALTANATDQPSRQLIDSAWDALGVFEGSPTSVTGDFDCQGMSIGVAQWNVGKSFGSVKSIVLAVPSAHLTTAMPAFGGSLVSKLHAGKNATLAFVRGFQEYGDSASCDSKNRKSRWTREGKDFRAELINLLGHADALKEQRRLREAVFMQGWSNAVGWARDGRGDSAEPSLKEVLLFVDMAIFNGGGFEKFGLSRSSLRSSDVDEHCLDALRYMANATDEFLLHKIASRKNSSFLKCENLEQNEKLLFGLTHQLALKLNADHARQFRLTVMNRRAAILFGSAYYSDRDSKPTIIIE